jgi:hypothetical protein
MHKFWRKILAENLGGKFSRKILVENLGGKFSQKILAENLGASLCRWFPFAQLAKGKKFRP